MKDALCRAFCADLAVRQIGSSTAVTTGFTAPDGDRIGFFVRPMTERGVHRIEDSGWLLAGLEANGFHLKTASRRESLDNLMREYGVLLDEKSDRFYMDEIEPAEIGRAALQFSAFMLRAHDFFLMTESKVASTFKEDVEALLREAAKDVASIEEDTPIVKGDADFVPDFIIRAPGRSPVGLFLCASEGRMLQAIVLRMRILHELHLDWPIVALLEREKAIPHGVRRQAANRLSAVREFRGDEKAAIQAVIQEATGNARFH